MKKAILLAAFAFTAFVSHAQTASTPAIDTATNAETVYLTATPKYFNGAPDAFWTAAFTGTKINGTTAGTVSLEVQADGTNFVPVKSHYGNYADTFLLANQAGAQAYIWHVTGRVTSARIKVVTTGSQSTQVKGNFIKK